MSPFEPLRKRIEELPIVPAANAAWPELSAACRAEQDRLTGDHGTWLTTTKSLVTAAKLAIESIGREVMRRLTGATKAQMSQEEERLHCPSELDMVRALLDRQPPTNDLKTMAADFGTMVHTVEALMQKLYGAMSGPWASEAVAMQVFEAIVAEQCRAVAKTVADANSAGRSEWTTYLARMAIAVTILPEYNQETDTADAMRAFLSDMGPHWQQKKMESVLAPWPAAHIIAATAMEKARGVIEAARQNAFHSVTAAWNASGPSMEAALHQVRLQLRNLLGEQP
jgi:hypothetical protein